MANFDIRVFKFLKKTSPQKLDCLMYYVSRNILVLIILIFVKILNQNDMLESFQLKKQIFANFLHFILDKSRLFRTIISNSQYSSNIS